MNWKFWKSKNSKKELKNIAEVFGYMESMQRQGLVYWQERNRRLLIHKEKTWRNFLHNCYLWQSSKLLSEAHGREIERQTTAALQEARKKYAVLTKADMERIRRAVLNEYDGMKVKVKVEPFDFFVVADRKEPMPRTAEDDAEAVGAITWVGMYDPDTEKLESSPWKDVERELAINN